MKEDYNSKRMKEVTETGMKKDSETSIKKDISKRMKKKDISRRMRKDITETTKKILEGVATSKNFAARGRAVVFGGIIIVLCCQVGTCPVDADPLSGSGSQSATSGSGGLPPAWSGRTGSSLTEQIMMRHVYEQIRSLKFAYEENINQLMRKVDTIDMKLARHSCDYNGIETLVRKIDSLDIKINRLETSNVHRLEELSKTIHTKGIRQELAMDGLVQKVDENHERTKQKLIFAEKRLDTINSKMQAFETSFTRVESRLTDIDNEISDISNTLDDIKSLSTYIDDKHNNTQRTMKEQLQTIKAESASRQQLEELSSSVKDIGSRLNDSTSMVRDDENVRLLSADTDRTLTMDLRTQINFESRKIEDKITSMYNNLWSRFMSLEATAKHLLKIGNITRRQLREDFQSLLQSEARFVEPESQENYMNLILDVLKRMLQEHKEQMDSNLQMSLTSQNLFIDSLNKSVHNSNRNEELKEMEITLSSILEKIIYTITNKTSRMDSRVVEVMQMIKEYKTQTMRSLSHLTKMVISLTEKNKEDRGRFEKGMLDLTKMNEIIASVLQDLYEKFEIIGNMTPACEETTKSTEFNNRTETENRELDETENTDNSKEELDKETVPENKSKIEIDDVVKIYSENGSNIEHTNASYQVLNTTNATQTDETTTKKHISIVIPFEAIEDGEELKSKIQDFLSQLPVSKTEAIILTNSRKQTSDSGNTTGENNDKNFEDIDGGELHSGKTIHIALNDGVSGNSTNFNNITTSFHNENRKNGKMFRGSAEDNTNTVHSNLSIIEPALRIAEGDEFQENVRNVKKNERKMTNDNEDEVPFSSPEETRILTKENEDKPQQNEEENRFYDLDGNEDFIPSSREETTPKENEEKPVQKGDEKKFYDLDGNEDMIRSMEEPTQERKIGEHFENLGHSNGMEAAIEERIIETSTVTNKTLSEFPISSTNNGENNIKATGSLGATHEDKMENLKTKNENMIRFPNLLQNSTTTEAINSSQSIRIGSTTKNMNTKIGNNSNSSILLTMTHQQGESSEQVGKNSTYSTEKIDTRIPTVLPTSTGSQISTVLPTSTMKSMLPNQRIIETTTNQNHNVKSKRRTKQDIKDLFEDLKAKRLQRIQELENLAQENEMMQKDFEDEIKNDESPIFEGDETPLARRDTGEHLRPITSSEEMTNSEPAFDLLYDDQELPYSA